MAFYRHGGKCGLGGAVLLLFLPHLESVVVRVLRSQLATGSLTSDFRGTCCGVSVLYPEILVSWLSYSRLLEADQVSLARHQSAEFTISYDNEKEMTCVELPPVIQQG